MKKTTEKINNLQMNSDLWPRPDQKDGGQAEVTPSVTSCTEEVDDEYVGLGLFIYLFI